jgi:molybdate transport system ATP-binding protein
MTLAIDIRHRLAKFLLEARFQADGGLIALFGRSGAGKTSLINVVAGLIRPDQGEVTVGGTVLVDTKRGIFVPRHLRRLGYVFQEGRLFPHLTVRQNLLYGRWFAPAGARRGDLDSVVDLLGIEAVLERRPGRLSGGEKQRVAIGRALLANPRLLLMDEPLASLDDARKAEILPYIERLRDQSRLPIIYVSHSIAEVARLASTIVVLSDGRVAAIGPAREIMHRLDLFPLTGRAEAGALIEAAVDGHDERFGLTQLRSRAGTWRLPRLEAPPGTRLRLRVRARDVMVANSLPQDVSALNIFAGVVADIAGQGAIVAIRIDCNGESLVARLKSVALDRRSLSGPIQRELSADAEARDD